MYRIVIASHGSLAEGMRSAAKMILNKVDAIDAFGLDTYEEPEVILGLVETLVEKNPNTTFFVLCDIKGGSVHNQLMQLLPRPNVKLFTGVNLSMVLTLATLEPDSYDEETTSEVLALSRANLQYYNPKELIKTAHTTEEDTLW